jgi:hypothetical protein
LVRYSAAPAASSRSLFPERVTSALTTTPGGQKRMCRRWRR